MIYFICCLKYWIFVLFTADFGFKSWIFSWVCSLNCMMAKETKVSCTNYSQLNENVRFRFLKSEGDRLVNWKTVEFETKFIKGCYLHSEAIRTLNLFGVQTDNVQKIIEEMCRWSWVLECSCSSISKTDTKSTIKNNEAIDSNIFKWSFCW